MNIPHRWFNGGVWRHLYRMSSPARSRLLVRIAAALTLYLMVEGFSCAGLALLRGLGRTSYSPTALALSPEARTNLKAFLARGKGEHMDMDPLLGWVPSRQDPEINSAGMRDDREYDLTPAAGILRISAFGDSFTFGSDVTLGDNWAKTIPRLASSIEVLNYGVPAYGLDQAYLRFLEIGSDYRPDVVFIGYMTENLARNVNVYRPFYSRAYRDSIFTKPRFRVENESLVLVPNPLSTIEAYRRLSEHEADVLREIGRHDYHFVGSYPACAFDFSPTVRLLTLGGATLRKAQQIPIFTGDGRYNERSEAYGVTLLIFDAFQRAVLERGAVPIIVVFPDSNDQQRSRAGKPRRYAPLLEHFRSKGYRWIDALEALERVEDRYAISDLSVRWGHYSKLGNHLVAQHILDQLSAWNLDVPSHSGRAAELDVNDRRRTGLFCDSCTSAPAP